MQGSAVGLSIELLGDLLEGGEEEISFCWEVLLDWASYGCNTLRTLLLPLIKHLRFFYMHVSQWCIVILVYLIYSNP